MEASGNMVPSLVLGLPVSGLGPGLPKSLSSYFGRRHSLVGWSLGAGTSTLWALL